MPLKIMVSHPLPFPLSPVGADVDASNGATSNFANCTSSTNSIVDTSGKFCSNIHHKNVYSRCTLPATNQISIWEAQNKKSKPKVETQIESILV